MAIKLLGTGPFVSSFMLQGEIELTTLRQFENFLFNSWELKTLVCKLKYKDRTYLVKDY